MAKGKGQEVAVNSKSSELVASSGDMPDYLKGTEKTGLEELGAGDFKIPRIMLLQPLSPAVRSFPGEAIPGHFWHTGMNISLGDKFEFVPVLARKRVILWRPRDDNDGGILAFSADGKTWQSGGNSKFTVKLRDRKEPVTWETGKDVQSSGLLDWGSSDPDDSESAPAATTSYEYLCYLLAHPHLSPCVLSCNKTALPKAKAFNTSLMMMAQARKPTTCLNVVCFVDEQTEGKNAWYVPNFKMNGTVSKEVYETTSKMQELHANYQAEILKEDNTQGEALVEEKAF